MSKLEARVTANELAGSGLKDVVSKLEARLTQSELKQHSSPGEAAGVCVHALMSMCSYLNVSSSIWVYWM